MSDGFPQYSSSAKQGNLGVAIVSRIVEEKYGWLFKKIHQEHDFGIDGQIEVVTEKGSVTGQMFACQIKCGKSFLKEMDKRGYVYRGETKHFNYLANYPVPVIIVVCDPITNDGCWVRFQAEDTEVTESGWKITIPRGNVLSVAKAQILEMLPSVRDHLSELKEYWRTTRMMFSVETFILMVGRDEVESGDISGVLGFWRRLLSNKDLALHCQGKVELLFSGYDSDARELFEIEDMRAYLARLDEALPELFFFIRTEEPAVTFELFIISLFWVGWEDQRSTPGSAKRVVIDLPKCLPFLESHFERLNDAAERLELPETELRRISQAIARPFRYPSKL